MKNVFYFTFVFFILCLGIYNNYKLNVDKVFVLNLERRPDRMKFMDDQLKKLNIFYTRFNACDGQKLIEYKDYYNRYIHPKGKVNRFKGQIGCTISHIKIWEEVVKNKYTHALVLEDDAIILNKNFKTHVNNLIKELPEKYNIVLLGGSILRGRLIKNKSYIINGSKLPKTNWFTTGYIINYKFAKFVLNKMKKEKTPFTVDEFLMRRVYPFLNYYLSVVPQLKQNKAFETDIIKSPVYSKLIIDFD